MIKINYILEGIILPCKMNKVHPIKKGVDYKTLNIRPFDLVLFNGGDAVSSFISCLSEEALGNGAGKFSHVGMIVTREILYDKDMEEGKLYIWESTASGRLGGDVYNIHGDAWIGTQIRDFDQVMKSYDANPNSSIAIRHIVNNPIDNPNDVHQIRETMAFLLGRYNEKPYEVNMMQLFTAMFPKLRCLRLKWGKNRFIFCSELVAIIYKAVDILSSTCDPSNVVPADFVVDDIDKQVCLEKFGPIQYIRYI